jgi:hypothetical protein
VDYWSDRLVHRDLLAEDRAILLRYLTNGGSDDTPISSVQARLPFLVALVLMIPMAMKSLLHTVSSPPKRAFLYTPSRKARRW